MMGSPPNLVDERNKKILQTQVLLHVAQGIILEREKSQADMAKMIVEAIQQECVNLYSKISSQVNVAIANHIPLQVDTSVRNYMSGHILHVHPSKDTTPSAQEQQYQLSSAVRPRDMDDPHDDAHLKGGRGIMQRGRRHLNSYVIDNDVIPNEKASQELVDEISQTIDEAHNCKGNSRPDKIVLSLHQFPAVIFPDDDIEERTFRWVEKCVKRFNPYARYEVEDWKNPHVKIFYIKKQQAHGKPKEEIYLNSKIVQIIKTYWELGVESYHQQVNLTAPTITFPGIKKYKMFSIISELVYGITYKNNKKEKRVIRHQEVYKFCDATLKRVLEGLKSYNNDVKYGYVTHNLSKEDVEYLQLFATEIEERLKYHDQMRRWEMYVNKRPLGSRREHPE
ncbi:hypothetical protein Tco_0713748 [Tanacetum coccineum]